MSSKLDRAPGRLPTLASWGRGTHFTFPFDGRFAAYVAGQKDPGKASATVVVLHPANSGPGAILELSIPLGLGDVAYVAPPAPTRVWYPASIGNDVQQVARSRAVDVVSRVLSRCAAAGCPFENTVLIGFSQGGSVVADFLLTSKVRLGGAAILAGAATADAMLVGSSLMRTPVYMSIGEEDTVVPLDSILKTQDMLRSLGAHVVLRIWPRFAHEFIMSDIPPLRRMIRLARRNPAVGHTNSSDAESPESLDKPEMVAALDGGVSG